jgi:nucleoside-diphosphate-sugar epimerase
MRVIVTGATGMAGAEVVRQCLVDPDIHGVTALVRRPLEAAHPKLAVVVHEDFLRYDAVLQRLTGHDACLWCLGVSQRDVPEPEYVRITRDYTLAGAAAMRSRGRPRIDWRNSACPACTSFAPATSSLCRRVPGGGWRRGCWRRSRRCSIACFPDPSSRRSIWRAR